MALTPIFEFCTHHTNTVILDVGSGSSTRYIAEKCFNSLITAIDIDFDKLKGLRVVINVCPILASASAIPLRTSSVDAVTMILILHELPRDLVEEVLKEANRVLRKNGFLLFIDKLLPQNATKPSEILT